tara:strand:+ start:1657 stop:4467 length:2811 start_codon:yes stop_codon:yes gene_type:complete
MTGITQTIPNYFGGISEQPDYKKNLGQVTNVINGIPDITTGLYKRPGSKRVDTSAITDGDRSHSTATGALHDIQSGGSFFHYYRDETEGSYIGQVASNGEVRVWRCSDGLRMDVVYGSTNSATATNLKAYLATNTPTDLSFLTINDTTFANNSTKTITKAGTTASSSATHTAFIELLKTENGRQYSLNVADSADEATYTTATRIEISSTTTGTNDRPAAGAPNTGHCPGIGTEVFNVTDGSKTNLIFRLSVRGQQGQSTSYATDHGDTDTNDYGCTYMDEVILLHGGEGWATNDTYDVTLSGYNYRIKVVAHETCRHTTKIGGVANAGLCRPEPTPFDADTAVTANAILGGLYSELSGITNVDVEIIGNGIYLSSNSVAFNVEIVENDLMKVITKTANDITDLPTQCKNGYIVKINNSSDSSEDDYYLKFEGENSKDGKGTWVECAGPGIDNGFTASIMPITIQRTAATTFTIDRATWKTRDVGDDDTNPYPSFTGQTITRILFWRNRLVILSGENAICSQPGDFYNFWNETALAVSPTDRIDIACSSSFPSKLVDGIQINNGLLVFSTDQQFLLTTDDSVLTSETARLSSVSTYNYNQKVSPISLGKSIGFLDSSGAYSKFFEGANFSSQGEPDLVNQTTVVPRLLSQDIDQLTNSRENSLILFGKSTTDEIIGYKYNNIGNERIQSSWFKWKLINPIRYHFIVGDSYYFLDDQGYLQQINLVQASTDPSLTQDNVNYLLHLDNYVPLSGGSYDTSTRKTTFTGVSWAGYSTSNGDLALTSSTAGKNFTKPTIDGTTLTADGDWTGSLFAGYLYDYQVDFPRFYVSKKEGDYTVGDVNSSLILHRIKVSFGRIGLYQSTLTRVGKSAFTDEYESTPADFIEGTDAPFLSEDIRTIPVYEKNTNVDLSVKSTHPAPATIRSISFEGDYSPMFYKNV